MAVYYSDEGARLLFKFGSGTHGLNKELGRHSDREGRVKCTLCGAECESVVHVLWECSSYSNCRDNFQEALKQLLGARLRRFAAFSEGGHRSRMGSAETYYYGDDSHPSAPVLGWRSVSRCWSWG